MGLLRTEQFGFIGRMALIRAGEKGSAEDIAAALKPALNDPNLQIRIHAAVVLARLGTPDGATSLRAITDADNSMEPLIQDLDQSLDAC